MYRRNGNLSTILHTKVERWHNILSDQENDLGQRYLQPVKVADVWAAVIPQTGTLLRGRVADTTLARTTHKIVIRYDPSLQVDEWFMYNGQRYNILYIMDPCLSSVYINPIGCNRSPLDVADQNQGGIATVPANGREAFGSYAITVNSVFCGNAIHYGGNTDVILSIAGLNDNGRVKVVYQNPATIQRSCMFVVFGK